MSNHLERLQKESEMRQKLDQWREERKQMMHEISCLHDKKGTTFAKSLKEFIEHWKLAPDYSGIEVIKQIAGKETVDYIESTNMAVNQISK